MHAHEGEWLLAVIVLLPLLGAVLNGLLGKRYLGIRGVNVVGVGSVALAAVLAWVLFGRMLGMEAHDRAFQLTMFEWIHVGSFKIDFSLWLDPLSVVMLLVNIG